MIKDSNFREDQRYRDIGSGISWQLLPSRILDFFFHKDIQFSLMKSWSRASGIEKVNWNETYGVGHFNNSDQLRVLVSTRTDIASMIEALSIIGNKINLPKGDADEVFETLKTSQTYRSVKTIRLIEEQMSRITLAKVYDYHPGGGIPGSRGDIQAFIEDHIGKRGLNKIHPPKYKLHSDNTNQTGHLNIVVRSIPIADTATTTKPSMAGMAQQERLEGQEKANSVASILRPSAKALYGQFPND